MVIECDYPDYVPIAWHDVNRRFEPIICIDTNGLVHFYDGYACPLYRCDTYHLREIIISPLPLDTSFNKVAKKLIEQLRKKGIDIADYQIVYWCYTGDKSCEESAWEDWQNALRKLAHYINNGYEIVEIREQDEGNSILVAVRADDIPLLEQYLNHNYIIA